MNTFTTKVPCHRCGTGTYWVGESRTATEHAIQCHKCGALWVYENKTYDEAMREHCEFIIHQMTSAKDTINPSHYKSHPSGIECIQITRHMSFNTGNAMKYIWRAGLKSPSATEDLNKAMWYLHDEIVRLGGTPQFKPV